MPEEIDVLLGHHDQQKQTDYSISSLSKLDTSCKEDIC